MKNKYYATSVFKKVKRTGMRIVYKFHILIVTYIVYQYLTYTSCKILKIYIYLTFQHHIFRSGVLQCMIFRKVHWHIAHPEK